MSRAQEPHGPFGNPFKKTSPKRSYLSPRLLEILNSFEDRLTLRLLELNITNKDDVLSLSWMKLGMDLLLETHADIKALLSDLDMPVVDWESKWTDVYLKNSLTMMDICNTFTSEIARLSQSNLVLQCALLKLESGSSAQYAESISFFDEWKKLISSKNPNSENCIVSALIETLDLPKVRSSVRGKIVIRAMYGLTTMAVYIYSVFTAAFTSSSNKLIDLHFPDTIAWADAFTDLQVSVNSQIRNQIANGPCTVLKELEAVDSAIQKLRPMIHGHTNSESLQRLVSELTKKSEQFTQGLDQLTTGVDNFFRVIVTSRDALLFSIKSSSTVFGSMENCGSA